MATSFIYSSTAVLATELLRNSVAGLSAPNKGYIPTFSNVCTFFLSLPKAEAHVNINGSSSNDGDNTFLFLLQSRYTLVGNVTGPQEYDNQNHRLTS